MAEGSNSNDIAASPLTLHCTVLCFGWSRTTAHTELLRTPSASHLADNMLEGRAASERNDDGDLLKDHAAQPLSGI